MKSNLIIIFSCIIIFHLGSSQNIKVCNDGTSCNLEHGNCIQYDNDKKKEFCKCHEGYDSNSNISEVKCNYKQKSQIKAFLLELLGFGAGHFYLNNYKYAILKFMMFVVLTLIYKCFNANSVVKFQKKNNKNEKYILKAILIIIGIFYIGVFFWHIIDLVFLGKNKYKDGNNIPLSIW